MADLTAQDVTEITNQINAYTSDVDKLAKDNGIEIKVSGNDPAELAKSTATGAASGAAAAAIIAPAAGPFAPAVIAAGAIIGAIAGFFSKFKFGPSPEAIALTKEFDGLNKTIHEVLAKVPQPYQTQIALLVINAMKRQPGPLPFCLEGGGCAMTDIKGVRDAAAGLNEQIKNWLSTHAAAPVAPAPFLTPFRIGAALLFVGLVGGGAYYLEKRR